MACAWTICSSTCDVAVVEPSLKRVIPMGGVVEGERGLDKVCSSPVELGGGVALGL